MTNQKNFFYDYFDGQIVKEDCEKYKLFKVLLISIVSLFGLFCWLSGFIAPAFLILLELGMIWNFYVKFESKLSVVFCVLVSAIYFVVACNFNLYANAIVYIGFYIPFQLFASTKTYYGGSFVQIKKQMNDQNQVLFITLLVFVSVILYMFDLGLGGRFILLDAISAGCLIASAILRNERYNDYYYVRAVALLVSIALWIVVAVEHQNFNAVIVAVMYFAYIIFDIGTNLMQKSTYENEYMQICEKYKEMENQNLVKQKLKAYKKSK